VVRVDPGEAALKLALERSRHFLEADDVGAGPLDEGSDLSSLEDSKSTL
jgi:hypothetical protein